MKVIVSGMPKTGTKSMAAALKVLGMNVYDFVEHYQYCGKDWMTIFDEGGSIEDFRRMYKGADAVTDMPACYFWEELHEAYPDAKIILTKRNSEEEWVKSLKAQQEKFNTPLVALLRWFSPTAMAFYHFAVAAGIAVFGTLNRSSFRLNKLNELLSKMTYRRHNAYVLQKAPKDKLLVYNVKEGWEPLCKFLGVDVPAKPFPHKNVGGELYEDYMQGNPVFIRMQRELMISFSVLTLFCSYGCYKVALYLAS